VLSLSGQGLQPSQGAADRSCPQLFAREVIAALRTPGSVTLSITAAAWWGLCLARLLISFFTVFIVGVARGRFVQPVQGCRRIGLRHGRGNRANDWSRPVASVSLSRYWAASSGCSSLLATVV